MMSVSQITWLLSFLLFNVFNMFLGWSRLFFSVTVLRDVILVIVLDWVFILRFNLFVFPVYHLFQDLWALQHFLTCTEAQHSCGSLHFTLIRRFNAEAHFVVNWFVLWDFTPIVFWKVVVLIDQTARMVLTVILQILKLLVFLICVVICSW